MIITSGFVGIDVSKRHLDVFDSTGSGSERLLNSQEALAPLLKRWKQANAFVLFEATGHYDLTLRRSLTGAGIRFARFRGTSGRVAPQPPAVPLCFADTHDLPQAWALRGPASC